MGGSGSSPGGSRGEDGAGSGSFGGSGGGSGTMPKNPTAADILSKLTGIPKSQLPASLDGRKITASDGSGEPSLADALSQLTGIPLDEMPDGLKDTPLTSLYDENSPYGSADTLFGEDSSVDDLLESVTGEGGADGTGSGRDSGDSGTGSGGSSPSGQDPLGILSNLLTQGIQAFTQLGSGLPGMDELARMLDPAQLQQHVQGLLDPAREQLDQLAGALGGGGAGGGAGAGVPGAGVTPPLSPYPEPQSAQLFPRAALAGPGMETAGYQSPTGSPHPMGGAPMGGAPGAGAGSAGGQNNEYKSAKYLQGRENLDEAWDVPDRVKPVIEP